MRASRCMRVDLPEPLLPTMAMLSPRWMSRLTPRSASKRADPRPYDLCRSVTESSGGGGSDAMTSLSPRGRGSASLGGGPPSPRGGIPRMPRAGDTRAERAVQMEGGCDRPGHGHPAAPGAAGYAPGSSTWSSRSSSSCRRSRPSRSRAAPVESARPRAHRAARAAAAAAPPMAADRLRRLHRALRQRLALGTLAPGAALATALAAYGMADRVGRREGEAAGGGSRGRGARGRQHRGDGRRGSTRGSCKVGLAVALAGRWATPRARAGRTSPPVLERARRAEQSARPRHVAA